MASILSVLVIIAPVVHLVGSQAGTTPDLEQVFKGRCYSYNSFRRGDLLPSVDVNCEELWTELYNAFVYIPRCNMTKDRYQDFVRLTMQDLPKDKNMFWENVYEEVSRFSRGGSRYITVADTLTGHLVDELVWCGQEEYPGVNNKTCPEFESCQDAVTTFWQEASEAFASSASGEVHVMFTGSKTDHPAYWRTSFFARWELPNLNVSRVTRVTVFLIHALDQPKLETCESESLKLMKDDVTARGLEFKCVDDPPEVMHMLCSDAPDSEDCQRFMATSKYCEANSSGVSQFSLPCSWTQHQYLIAEQIGRTKPIPSHFLGEYSGAAIFQDIYPKDTIHVLRPTWGAKRTRDNIMCFYNIKMI